VQKGEGAFTHYKVKLRKFTFRSREKRAVQCCGLQNMPVIFYCPAS